MPASSDGKRRRRSQTVNLDTLGLEMGNRPPQALDVEEAVLGALLVEPNCVDDAMEELTSGCFFSEKHRMIFEAMLHLVNSHVSIDPLTVSQQLRADGNLDAVGGPVVLAQLSQKIGAAAHIEFYIKILKQKCIQRDLITASYTILKDAYDESINVDTLIDTAQTKIFGAIQNNVKKDVQEIGSVITLAISDIERLQESTGLSGVPSGFPSLDKITFGWQPSDLIILAARPSVGKTAFVLNVARNAAVDHHMPVAFLRHSGPSGHGIPFQGKEACEPEGHKADNSRLSSAYAGPGRTSRTQGTGSRGNFKDTKGYGKGTQCAYHSAFTAEPNCRKQAGVQRPSFAERPARVGIHRAGCRYGPVYTQG